MMKLTKTMFFSVLLPCFAAIGLCAGEAAFVSGTNVALRVKPATYYERLAMLPRGTALEIVKTENGWHEVRIPVKVRGWVAADAVNGDGKVTSEPCPVYSGAGDHFNFFHMAPLDTSLKLTGRKDGNWVEVEAPEAATAWISSQFVTIGALPQIPENIQGADNGGVDEAELAARRAELKLKHAEETHRLQQDENRLKELQLQAEQLRADTARNAGEVKSLQNEAERLEALRDAAQAKARLAQAEREKAQLEEQQLLQQLAQQQQEAQKKAQSVQEDSARWEQIAAENEKKLKEAQAAAALRAEAAAKEADAIAAEQLLAEKRAAEAFQKVESARKRIADSEAQHNAMAAEITRLVQAVDTSRQQAEKLRLEREAMEKANLEANAKLDAARQEAARLAEAARETEAKLTLLREEAKKRDAAQAELEAMQRQAEEAKSSSAELEKQLADARKQAEEAQALREKQAKELAAMQEAASQAPEPEVVPAPQPTYTGIVISLGSRATADATHALCINENGKYIPVCYLVSRRVKLANWERREVEIHGITRQMRGWKHPLVEVNGIMRK